MIDDEFKKLDANNADRQRAQKALAAAKEMERKMSAKLTTFQLGTMTCMATPRMEAEIRATYESNKNQKATLR